MDDDFFPRGAPVGVLEIVDLVENDPPQPAERRRPGVQHVAQDFGGHDHHRSVGVDGVVPGQQPNVVDAVATHQIVKLLVRQGLDRGRVERLGTGAQRLIHSVLGHHRLARARWCCHQHGLTGIYSGESFELETIEGERHAVRRRGIREVVQGHALRHCSGGDGPPPSRSRWRPRTAGTWVRPAPSG